MHILEALYEMTSRNYRLCCHANNACHHLRLTHWGRVTHIYVSKLTIIGSDNGWSPDRYQAIIRTNAGILLIRTFGTNFSEIWSEIHTVSFTKMHLNMSSAKWRPFCLGLNVLICQSYAEISISTHPPAITRHFAVRGSNRYDMDSLLYL